LLRERGQPHAARPGEGRGSRVDDGHRGIQRAGWDQDPHRRAPRSAPVGGPMPFVVSALLALSRVEGLQLQDAAKLDWKQDYDAALQEAKKDGRFVVVVFGGPDCPPCAKMHETTFKDKAVVEHVNKTY